MRSQEEELNKNNVVIYEKLTKIENVAKIVFLIVSNVQFSNVKNYKKKYIAETIGCDKNKFEVSRGL